MHDFFGSVRRYFTAADTVTARSGLIQARLAQIGSDALIVQIELAGTVAQMGLALDSDLQRELRVKS